MAEVYVARIDEFPDPGHHVVRHGELEIGVLRRNGRFFAYSNYCLHQGGPACEGLIIAQVEEAIGEQGVSLGLRFSETEVHFVCPWHGYEYVLETGVCATDSRKRLRKFDVISREDSVYVII